MTDILHYLNESPTVFFILKKKVNRWELEYVTDNVVNIYGKSSIEFLNGKYYHEDFIHKVDLKKFTEQASLISKTDKKEFTYEPYRIMKGNDIVWINHTTKIIRDEDGLVSSYYGYITDITKQKELYNKFTATSNILDSSFNNSFNFILLLDSRGKLLKANQTALDIAGIKEEAVLGKYYWELPWWSHYPEEERNSLRDDILSVVRGSCLKNHKIYYNKEGKRIESDCSLTPVFDDDKNVSYILCEAHDITQTINTKRSLDQYMRIVNENVYISISDLKGNILEISDAYCRLTGYNREELIGQKHSIFKHPDNDSYIFKELWNTIVKGRLWKGEHRNVKKNGDVFWVENSITPNLDENKRVTGYTSIYNDITDKKEISELLITDYLTKIFNRRHFNDIFGTELKRSKRDNTNFALIILDIDYFKQYNDTYGHDSGDKTLYTVANTIKHALHRASDFVFRLGGEEFGVITSNIDEDGAKTLAQMIKKSIEDLKIEHKNSQISDYLTISIGIKLVKPESILSKNEIYKLADLALYEAKTKGRNQTVISQTDILA